MNDRETHPLATATQIAELLGKADPRHWARTRTDRQGSITLSNAEARRLLTLAEKGQVPA